MKTVPLDGITLLKRKSPFFILSSLNFFFKKYFHDKKIIIIITKQQKITRIEINKHSISIISMKDRQIKKHSSRSCHTKCKVNGKQCFICSDPEVRFRKELSLPTSVS